MEVEGGSSVEKGRGEQPSLLLRREKEEEKMSSEAPEEFRPHPIIHFRRELGQAYKPNRVPRRRPIGAFVFYHVAQQHQERNRGWETHLTAREQIDCQQNTTRSFCWALRIQAPFVQDASG